MITKPETAGAGKFAALSELSGDPAGIAMALLDLGGIADNRNAEQARAYLQENLAIFRERGDLLGIAYALTTWA